MVRNSPATEVVFRRRPNDGSEVKSIEARDSSVGNTACWILGRRFSSVSQQRADTQKAVQQYKSTALYKELCAREKSVAKLVGYTFGIRIYDFCYAAVE